MQGGDGHADTRGVVFGHRKPRASLCEIREVDVSDARDWGKVPQPRAGDSQEQPPRGVSGPDKSRERAGAGGTALEQPGMGLPAAGRALRCSKAPGFPSPLLPLLPPAALGAEAGEGMRQP